MAAERFVTFLHPVNAQSVRALLNTLTETIANYDTKRITLLMSTPGGDVNEGILLFNALRALPIELTTHNLGNVDSIGNVVFLAGAKRYANPNATFMWHGVGVDVGGPTRFELKNTREVLGNIEAATKRMTQTVAACTKLTEQQIHELFVEQSTKNTEFALANGLIHGVAEPQVPNMNLLVQSPAT